MRKVPNTIWTRAENGQNREPKNSLTLQLWNPHKTIFWASRNLALEHRFRKPRTAKHKPENRELCKTQAGSTAEAKSPKLHLDTSRKRPKPDAKKSCKRYHLESKKNSFGPQEHMPSRGKTETTLRKSRLEAQLPSIKLLGNSTRKHAAKLSRNLAIAHRFRKPRTAKHKLVAL